VENLGLQWNRFAHATVLAMLIALVGCQSVSTNQATVTPPTGPSNTANISGTITPQSTGSGVTVMLGGATSATTTANSSGSYSFTNLGSGSYTITASKKGLSFTPPSLQVTVSGSNVTGQNFTVYSGPVVNISPGTAIQTVVEANPAGTTFVLQPGIYRLQSSISPKDGDSFVGQTSCAPPTTSCPAILSGSTVIGSLAVFDGKNYEVSGQTQQGFQGEPTDCDPGWPGCIYPEDLFFDGKPLQHLDSAALPTIGTGQWWFDYANHIIYFHDNPSGHTVETSVLNNAFGGAANNVTIQYLTIEEFANMYPVGAIGVSEGSPLTQGANWTVENCEAKLNHGDGVRVGYGTQILNNYVHDNGQMGVGGGIGATSDPQTESINSGVLIQGNIISHNNYAHFNPSFGAGGFKIGATSGIVLRGNTIQNNEGSGIHFDAYSQNELVDGNTITDNSDADGLVQEIGYGISTFRNNVVQRNGAQLNSSNTSAQIAVRASAGVSAYCNVMEVSNGASIGGWAVDAANRGSSSYPQFQYLATTGNSFHHNTVIWASGASGDVGHMQTDTTNQPNFFADNTPPDYNTYHMPSLSAAVFLYDNDNSGSNTQKTFGDYQSSGADAHGTADTNYTNGFPTVAITSPTDQASVTTPVTVAAAASDASGISKVEFYVDWSLQTTVTSSPYNFSWTDGTPGPHTVAAMAYSKAGVSSCNAVTLFQQ
jgi:parallel beta-helix repeat protein